ncbi:YD repeat-containing protein [Chitinophaga sp. CF118]|uniref:RHS repeat domain-containing protein n=1 Tax=Chitinophaga sp. CF118 TaxID=1884367 RepID=UPI0008F25850|nr:RHS repeat domain-containing protein [Chitinophaga sp. CF118]SFD98700.1 YD repeat-containing protein [Chitinophaga sp. CF118]
MKILSYLLALLFAVNSNLYAQETSLNPTKFTVIPPAPNAMALGKYGDIPVSLSNGLPSISIPLTNITVSDEFSMDVDVSYHASGVRVDEIATYTGLNWTLNAGGAITRVVKGKKDEAGYIGQLDGNKIPTSFATDAVDSTYEVFRNSAQGIIDTQPDEFSFNFGGYSGKFVIGTNNEAYLMPYKNFRIKWLFNGAFYYFVAITDNGTQYIFKDSETSYTISCGANEDETTNAWYLTTIILPRSKRRINFIYVTDPSLTVYSMSESDATNLYPDPAKPLQGCPVIIPLHSNCANYRTTFQNKIKRIDYPGGQIDFNYGFIRNDLSNSNLDTFYALSSIVSSGFLNGTITPLKRFTFDYTNGSRLQLKQVSNADIYGNVISSYKLTYNTAHNFPDLDSKAQDHWGYFNGKIYNTTLLPAEEGVDGGDREPDTDYIKTGILEKIEYPTGGSSSFEYENNTYSRFNIVDSVYDPLYLPASVSKEIRTGYYSAQIQYPNYLSDSITFNINKHQFVNSTATLQACCGNSVSMFIRNVSTGQQWNVANGQSYVELDSGQYHIVLACAHDEPTATYEKAQITLQYKNVTSYTKIAKAGGLRIRRMTIYDGINHANDIVKTYFYRFGNDSIRSTGWLFNKPAYKYSFTAMKQPGCSACGFDNPQGEYPCITRIRSSSANNEISFSHGGSLVYQEVLEASRNNNENGSTRYKYYVASDANPFVSYPFSPFTNTHPLNGMEESRSVFDNAGKLLSKTITEYETYLKGNITGWKVGYLKKGLISLGAGVEQFLARRYFYNSYAVMQQRTTQKEYLGTDSIINITEYTYDNKQHIQPTRVHKVTSKKDDLWIYNKYPTDYTIPTGTLSAGLQVLKMMQDSNIHSMMIEQYVQQIRSGITTTLSATQVQYKTNIQGVVMGSTYKLKRTAPLIAFTPTTIQSNDFVRDTNYEQDIAFNTYDSTGNIREQRKVNDVNEVYIWGYNNLYPVAKISGSSYTSATSYVNMNILRNPASDTQLRTELNKIRMGLASVNALVNTYTYKMGVGVTSETDAAGKTIFYEYDRFGRLKLIKDADDKILKQFSYQYSLTY